MVGIRIFLILIMGLLLFNTPLYALMLSDIEESTFTEDTEEEAIPEEIKEEIEKIEMEKAKLMEEISILREGRGDALHPFVSNTETTIPEDMPARHAVKGFVPVASSSQVSSTGPSGQRPASRLLPNLIFFFVMAITCLAAYLFIRPKSK